LRFYGSISLDKQANEWILDHVEPHVIIKLKSIFKKIKKTESNPFHFKNTTEGCLELEWFLQRYPMEGSPEDLILLHSGKMEHLQAIDDLEKLLKPDYKAKDYGLKLPLRDYQAQVVELFFKKKRLLIGDDVGLGKTLCGIASATNKACLPVIVVVQTHLPIQWKEQIEKFMDAKIHIIKGTTPYALPEADFYILKYSCLAGWGSTLAQLEVANCLVFDEIQELRIKGSLKHSGAKKLISSAEYVMGLSATPIFNYGEEIYNVLDLINPECLGDEREFMREWTGYSRVVQNPKALGTYLRENFLMVRRTREDVKKELPPINKIVHTVDFDEKAVKDVEDLARILAVKVTSDSNPLVRGQAARELDMLMRHSTGVSKAKYVADYVKILLENKEPVLLAGWHRDVYDIWLKELAKYNPAMYTGSESAVQKEVSKKRFIEGDTDLMIISLRSGIGLDGLQNRCSIVTFGELDWSPAVHHQVTGRLARDGQEDQVTAIYLVSESGSDPLIVNLLGLKASQAQDILNPYAGVSEQYSDESRITQLAQNILSKMNTDK